jgi:FkbM family methyltransferase
MNLLKILKEINFYIYINKKFKKKKKLNLYIFVFLIIIFGKITSLINFRLYYRLSKLISFFISKDIICKIKILNDTNFKFYLNDPYYNRLIYKDYHYEIEIENFLKKINKINYVFFDAGANYGYWSSIVSSKKFGSHRAIAIEPVKKNFFMCKTNCDLNNSKFTLINKGISNIACTKNIYVDESTSSAVGSSLLKPKNRLYKKEKINIIPITKILKKYKKFKYHIIKLDIEGEEINCLKTIKQNSKNKLLIIYEDHGSDKKNTPTRYLLKKGYKVFIGLENKFFKIKKYTDLDKYKKRKTVGYNIFATTSKEFLNKLEDDS